MKSLLTIITIIFISFYSFAQPEPDFTASPLEICVGESVQFSDLSTSALPISSWTWDFGDGSTSSSQNPSHTYTSPGTFTIILTAGNANGAVSEVKTGFIKVNPLPSPAFTPTILGGCSVPSNVSINNVQPSSGATYSWDFGNGTTSTSGTPGNVTYVNEGSYDITLTVSDNITGCENSITQTLEIVDYTADFSFATSTACVGSTINFTDNSSVGTDSWSWDFGDGTTSTSQNPSHGFSNSGVYTVTLTASNSTNGCSGVYSEQIEVFTSSVPSFTFDPASGCTPLNVTFTNTSNNGNATFEWNFGDGTTYTGENPPVHTYTNNGSYTITLIQTDENGCIDSIVHSDAINISAIEADFEADVVEGCETLEVTFSDLSISPNPNDPITGWSWNFGNGSTFNGQNPPTQSYNEGVYDVTLTVTSDAGCSHTLNVAEYISVGVTPDIDFSWTPSHECAKSDFEFTSTVTVPVPHDSDELTYEWDFGDGGTASEPNPTYNYPIDTGYFDVQLIVKFRGCPDTLIYENAVYIDAPIALFNVSSAFCNPTLPLDVTFNDQAIIGKETDDATVIWDWGDGSTDVFTSPSVYDDNPGQITHTYTSLGSYNIKQVVHNYTTGCSDSITRTIHLSEIEALFTPSSDSICFNETVYLSDDGSTSTHAINNYIYNINNDTIIQGPTNSHTFLAPGTYDITYTVSNYVGCQDSKVFSGFEVLSLPVANISPSDLAGCKPLTVTFTNNSVSQSGVPLSNFDWSFEDGSVINSTNINQTINYTFTNEGVFLTQLTTTDEFGCVSPTASVFTELTKPTALFDAPEVVCNDEVFTLTNNSTNYTASEWFINTYTSLASTDNDFTTSLNHTGSPTNLSHLDEIILIVTDANGCKDTLIQEVITSTPHADFDFVFSGANINDDDNFVCPPIFADFTDVSGAYGDITNWDWNFGDTKLSTLQHPNNTYVFAGTYTGSLIITDEFGCSDTMIYVDYLTIEGPKGEVDWEIYDMCNHEYTFYPSNLDGVSDILWIMGNGDTINSIEQFNYAYHDGPGTYIPSAILINDDNCNIPYTLDPITLNVNLLDAYFEINPLSLNWGEPATFSDYSTGGYGGIVDWFWDAGGETFSNNGGTFDYLFNVAGDEVIVELVVTDSAGCQSSYQVIVSITANITAPNVLTANGDGVNDVFRLIDNPYKNYHVSILNRWGNVVSETYVVEDDYLWDGLNKRGEKCVDGVYFYKIDGTQRDNSHRVEHGFVHLFR